VNTVKFGIQIRQPEDPMRSLPVLLLVACAHASEPPKEVGTPPVAVRTEPVEVRAVRRTVHGAGRVRAADEVTLSFPSGGVVAQVKVEAGERVTRGQVLAVLDAGPARARRDGALSAVEKAERDFARATALEGSGLARQQREDATTGLEVAQANLEAASFEVRRSVLVAPADGIVLDRFADPDQTVAPGGPVVRLAIDAAWELGVAVPAADALRVDVGMPATATLAAYPGESFPGRVVRRAGGAGGLGTWTVTVALDPTDRALASGLVGGADLAPESDPLPVVPLSALAEVNGSVAAVYVVDEGAVARRVPVTIASFDGDDVALSSPREGLVEVITVGTAFVRDGAPVRTEVR
jgi:RND family efflux transporter MFP subunit